MSRKLSKRVSFNPDHANDKPAAIFLKGGGAAKVAGTRVRIAGIFIFRLPKSSGFSPAKFLRRLGSKVESALRFVSSRRRYSRKVSSANLARSRSLVESIDSQRAEAIEDCIEFLNSSSLQRSNSVSSTC